MIFDNTEIEVFWAYLLIHTQSFTEVLEEVPYEDVVFDVVSSEFPNPSNRHLLLLRRQLYLYTFDEDSESLPLVFRDQNAIVYQLVH